MKTRTTALGGAAVVAMFAAAAFADPVDDTLILNGETEMVTRTAAPEHLSDAMDEVLSGWLFRESETRVMQADDFDNPAMLYVEQAIDVWNTVDGSEGKSCASCHNEPESLRGLRAELPNWNEEKQAVYTAEMYVNDCRTERMGAEAWEWNGQTMRNMTALIASVSRGLPVNVAIDGPVQSTWEKGKELYFTRFGQLDLACSNCHEDNYGNMIRADHLSQGQINAFPSYRLKDANLVSIHNRFRGCIRDTRGETFSVGSPEFVALELYVASRGNGLSVEGPSVRN